MKEVPALCLPIKWKVDGDVSSHSDSSGTGGFMGSVAVDTGVTV